MVYQYQGEYGSPDTVEYRGHFQNGRREGEGVITWMCDATQFKGTWKNGRRHQGIFRMQDGVVNGLKYSKKYDGPWVKDLPHGQGTLILGDRRIYKGEFTEGTCPNYGQIIERNGGIYTGELM